MGSQAEEVALVVRFETLPPLPTVVPMHRMPYLTLSVSKEGKGPMGILTITQVPVHATKAGTFVASNLGGNRSASMLTTQAIHKRPSSKRTSLFVPLEGFIATAVYLKLSGSMGRS